MVTQTYKLNMIPGGNIVVVHVSQYDIGREIAFNLYNGSTSFTPASGTTATIDGTKPDKKGFSLTATITGSTAKFDTTKNMCAVAGDTICEFRLMKNGDNVGTANFILRVERAGLADDVDTSATELPAYEAAAQQAAQDAADSAGAASSSATSAATNALKAEGYAVGKQNGQAVASGSPYYHNNAEYFSGLAGQSATDAASSATAAAASVAQGTQVRFYIENGHLFVVQTIGGVEQQPQDLGEVTGGGQADYVFDTVAEMNTAIAGGTVPNGATCYVREDITNADTTRY